MPNTAELQRLTAEDESEVLQRRVQSAGRDTQDAWMKLRGIKEAGTSLSMTGRAAGYTVPTWARTALTATEMRAMEAYTAAVNTELAARAALRTHTDHRVAAAEARAAALAAGQVTT